MSTVCNSTSSSNYGKYPEMFNDPVTYNLMENPHTDIHGHTFDLATLEEWAKRKGHAEDDDVVFPCPLSNEEISLLTLVPNLLIKEACEAIKNGTYYKNQHLHVSSRSKSSSSQSSLDSSSKSTSSASSSAIYVDNPITKKKQCWCNEAIRRVKLSLGIVMHGNVPKSKIAVNASSSKSIKNAEKTEYSDSVSFHQTNSDKSLSKSNKGNVIKV